MPDSNQKQPIDPWMAKLTDPSVEISKDDLRVALTDALQRIIALEKAKVDLDEFFRAFSEQVDAARSGVVGRG